MLLIDAKVADAGAKADVGTLGGGGDHIQGTCHSVRTIEIRARAFENFDAVDGMSWQRKIGIMMSSLDVIHAKAVKQHQCLAETRATNGDVGLNIVGAALA